MQIFIFTMFYFSFYLYLFFKQSLKKEEQNKYDIKIFMNKKKSTYIIPINVINLCVNKNKTEIKEDENHLKKTLLVSQNQKKKNQIDC